MSAPFNPEPGQEPLPIPSLPPQEPESDPTEPIFGVKIVQPSGSGPNLGGPSVLVEGDRDPNDLLGRPIGAPAGYYHKNSIGSPHTIRLSNGIETTIWPDRATLPRAFNDEAWDRIGVIYHDVERRQITVTVDTTASGIGFYDVHDSVPVFSRLVFILATDVPSSGLYYRPVLFEQLKPLAGMRLLGHGKLGFPCVYISDFVTGIPARPIVLTGEVASTAPTEAAPPVVSMPGPSPSISGGVGAPMLSVGESQSDQEPIERSFRTGGPPETDTDGQATAAGSPLGYLLGSILIGVAMAIGGLA